MKILVCLFFLLLLGYVNAQVSEGLPGNDVFPTSQNQASNVSADIYCEEGSFWSIISFGSIIRWTIAGGVISFSDTVFQTSPINSLAFSNNLNTTLVSKTFYGSDGHDIMYFNGNNWDSLATPPNVNFFGNCGGFHGDLYYTAINNNGGAPSEIYRYDGTSTTLITSLGLNRNFAVADLAVDAMGNIWTLVGSSTNADSLVQFSPNGTRLNAFPMTLDCMNAYGSFMLNDVYYIGLGNAHPAHPQTIVSVNVTGNHGVIQNIMPFPSMGFADLASCVPGNFIPLAVNETKASDDFNIYPNPFSESTRLIVPDNFSFPANISVLDFSEKIVFSGKIQSQQLNMLDELAAGMYIIQIDGIGMKRRIVKM